MRCQRLRSRNSAAKSITAIKKNLSLHACICTKLLSRTNQCHVYYNLHHVSCTSVTKNNNNSNNKSCQAYHRTQPRRFFLQHVSAVSSPMNLSKNLNKNIFVFITTCFCRALILKLARFSSCELIKDRGHFFIFMIFPR